MLIKYKSLNLLFIIFGFNLFLLTNATAQQNLDPLEIKGGSSLIYHELKIEIISIKKVQEYQAYFRRSKVPRGPKRVAEEGQEFAVIQVHTTNLSEKPPYPNGEKARNGFRLHAISVFDSKGKEYPGNQSGPAIGSVGDAHNEIFKENDFEFAVQVPKGIMISAVQIQDAIYRETQPNTIIQKLTFDVIGLKD